MGNSCFRTRLVVFYMNFHSLTTLPGWLETGQLKTRLARFDTVSLFYLSVISLFMMRPRMSTFTALSAI